MSCGRQWHALGTWWRSSTIESIVIGFVPFVLPSSYPLQDMGSRSPSRGRSRSRSHTPPSARPADRSLSRAPAHIHHHTHLLLDVASLRGRNQTRDRAHARLCHVIQGTDTERIGILLGLLHEVGAQVEVQAAGYIERGAIRAVRADMARLWLKSSQKMSTRLTCVRYSVPTGKLSRWICP
jgi:hypothetical protein